MTKKNKMGRWLFLVFILSVLLYQLFTDSDENDPYPTLKSSSHSSTDHSRTPPEPRLQQPVKEAIQKEEELTRPDNNESERYAFLFTENEATPEGLSFKVWNPESPEVVEIEPGFYGQKLKTTPGFIEQLHLGQLLELPIPGLEKSVHVELTETRNVYKGREVWRGKVLGGRAVDSFSITRGEAMTIISVGTLQGVFTLSINNKTGEGVLINESEAITIAPLG